MATPPLEASIVLISVWMTRGIGIENAREDMVMDLIDVRRAYCHAMARQDVYVELPEEDAEEGMCGKLIRSMYGAGDAAQNWEAEYVQLMEDIGFDSGRSSPCTFHHKVQDDRAIVHWDDFTMLGSGKDVDWFRKNIETKFENKHKGRLGPCKNNINSVRILNRIVTHTDGGIEYESDTRRLRVRQN